jgi:hypothetical protein
LFIAGHDAAFAADALRHVKVEAILLTWSWRRRQLSANSRAAKRIQWHIYPHVSRRCVSACDRWGSHKRNKAGLGEGAL